MSTKGADLLINSFASSGLSESSRPKKQGEQHISAFSEVLKTVPKAKEREQSRLPSNNSEKPIKAGEENKNSQENIALKISEQELFVTDALEKEVKANCEESDEISSRKMEDDQRQSIVTIVGGSVLAPQSTELNETEINSSFLPKEQKPDSANKIELKSDKQELAVDGIKMDGILDAASVLNSKSPNSTTQKDTEVLGFATREERNIAATTSLNNSKDLSEKANAKILKPTTAQLEKNEQRKTVILEKAVTNSKESIKIVEEGKFNGKIEMQLAKKEMPIDDTILQDNKLVATSLEANDLDQDFGFERERNNSNFIAMSSTVTETETEGLLISFKEAVNLLPKEANIPHRNDQVVMAVNTAVSRGKSDITLSLFPESLGSVEVRIEFSKIGEVHSVKFYAEKQETLALLSNDAKALENSLSKVVNIDDASLSFNLKDGNENSNNFEQPQQQLNIVQDEDNTSSVTNKSYTTTSVPKSVMDDGRVDLHV